MGMLKCLLESVGLRAWREWPHTPLTLLMLAIREDRAAAWAHQARPVRRSRGLSPNSTVALRRHVLKPQGGLRRGGAAAVGLRLCDAHDTPCGQRS